MWSDLRVVGENLLRKLLVVREDLFILNIIFFLELKQTQGCPLIFSRSTKLIMLGAIASFYGSTLYIWY